MCSSRLCFVFINLLFLVFSVFLLIIGAVVQTSLNGTYGLFRGQLSVPAALTVTFGVLLFSTALLALLSALYKGNRILSAYVFALVILIVIELSVGIAGFIVKPRLLKVITADLRSAESKYTSNRLVNTTWDSLQQDLKCCGVDHYQEWFRYLGNFSLPDSCCALYTVDCGGDSISTGNFYRRDCAEALSQWTNSNEVTIAILYSGLVILHLVCLLCLHRYAFVPKLDDSMLDDL